MEEENRINENQQEKLSEYLTKLAEKEIVYIKVSAQLAMREKNDQITQAVSDTRTNMEMQAKNFGVKLKNMEENYKKQSESKKGILEEYQDSLEEINQAGEPMLKAILEIKAQKENDEIENFLNINEKNKELKEAQEDFDKQQESLKKEIDQAVQEGNAEVLKAKTKELDQLKGTHKVFKIKKERQELQDKKENLRQEVESLEETFEKVKAELIEKIKQQRDTALATIPKQNIFQKIFGAVFTKLNGAKKFMGQVVGPLKAKIGHIKDEEIPKTQELVSQELNEMVASILEGKDYVVSQGKGTWKAVIDKTAAMKGNMIQKAQQALIAKEEEIAQKQVRLNKMLHKDEEEYTQ